MLTGERRTERTDVHLDVHLLVEISARIGSEDVARAARRAALLERLVGEVMPVVVGDSIGVRATALARERGVWLVLDGRATGPEDQSS